MMVIGATFVAAISLLTGLGADQSRVLWQGPALAGDAVVWGEAAGATGSLHQWTQRRGERVLYRSDTLALGRPLAASRTLLAFERTYPSCKPQPNFVCPQAEDALVGPPQGPFRTLVRPRKCSMATLGNTLALDGGVAAYLEVDCEAQRMRIVVRDVGHAGKPLIVRDAALSSGCCRDVAIAGRFVAWSDRNDVVVYDRLARRLAYRVRIGPAAGIDVDFGFDLQRDGKVAVSYRLVEFARTGPTTIAWLSPSAPRLHLLRLRASDTRIRIAGDRIAAERFLSPSRSVLVVADLAGRARPVAGFAPPVRLRGRFDFDGRQMAWASDRVTSTRVDCPPPGQERPCVLRESGVTSIWIRAAKGGAPRLIARLRFDDTTHRP
ncbi:MAG: hypothetical protein ACXWZ8_02465 [Gaiellaceae bacterium]